MKTRKRELWVDKCQQPFVVLCCHSEHHHLEFYQVMSSGIPRRESGKANVPGCQVRGVAKLPPSLPQLHHILLPLWATSLWAAPGGSSESRGSHERPPWPSVGLLEAEAFRRLSEGWQGCMRPLQHLLRWQQVVTFPGGGVAPLEVCPRHQFPPPGTPLVMRGIPLLHRFVAGCGCLIKFSLPHA